MKLNDIENAQRTVAFHTSFSGWLVLLLFVFGLFASGTAQAQEASSQEQVQPATTFLVVRHGEREGEADALSEAGKRRAEQLRSLGQLLHVTAIYSTDYRRTKETAAPLAESLGVEPQLYQELTPQWLADLRTTNRGGVVLIVGHSNTIATIASQLADAPVAEIQPTEYDNLFVISEEGTARSLIRLRFGSSQASAALPLEKMSPRPPTSGQPKQGAGSRGR